jgi:predicted nucleic acid-binding protein
MVELVANALDPQALGDEELAAPHLIDSEVTSVLRRLANRGALTDRQATDALNGFAQLTFARFPAHWLLPRMWELRHNVSAYDATYVALAEMIDATTLLTTDARLADAPGIRCPVTVV